MCVVVYAAVVYLTWMWLPSIGCLGACTLGGLALCGFGALWEWYLLE